MGALALVSGDGEIELEGLLANMDGRVILRHRMAGDDPAALGAVLAAHILDRAGGRSLLEDLGRTAAGGGR